MTQYCKKAILNWECPLTRSAFTLIALWLYGSFGSGWLDITYRTGPNQWTSTSFWNIVLFKKIPGAWLNILTVGVFYALWTFVLLLICYPNFFSRKSAKTLRARFGGINAALPLFSAAVLAASLWLRSGFWRTKVLEGVLSPMSPVPFLWAIPLCVWLCRHQLKAHLRTPWQLVGILLPAVPLVLYCGIFTCYALYDIRIDIDNVGLWRIGVPVLCAVLEGLVVLRLSRSTQKETNIIA